jgi:hypothetical protein
LGPHWPGHRRSGEANRGEPRAEVNKLLAAVLENEPGFLRRLLVFSVLIERATALPETERRGSVVENGAKTRRRGRKMSNETDDIRKAMIEGS